MKKALVIALLIILFGIGVIVYLAFYQDEQSDALDYTNVKLEN